MTLNLDYIDDKRKAKMHSDVREVVLRRMEGKHVTTQSGLVDNRLYSGDNNLRLCRLPATNLWSFRQEKGITPEPLKQNFTSVKEATNFATNYFKKRGLQVVELVDA